MWEVGRRGGGEGGGGCEGLAKGTVKRKDLTQKPCKIVPSYPQVIPKLAEDLSPAWPWMSVHPCGRSCFLIWLLSVSVPPWCAFARDQSASISWRDSVLGLRAAVAVVVVGRDRAGVLLQYLEGFGHGERVGHALKVPEGLPLLDVDGFEDDGMAGQVEFHGDQFPVAGGNLALGDLEGAAF